MAASRKIETGSWVFDRDSGELVPSGQFYARKFSGVARSDVPCPRIVSDCIELQSMADGKTYTSKRAYYDSLKRSGHEIVGGMDPSSYVAKSPTYKQHEADIAADVRRAIQEVTSR
jgi:hypothetical protein